eukprot:scaffold191272_cov19-Tisochrysis_lutea.AAC.1
MEISAAHTECSTPARCQFSRQKSIPMFLGKYGNIQQEHPCPDVFAIGTPKQGSASKQPNSHVHDLKQKLLSPFHL